MQDVVRRHQDILLKSNFLHPFSPTFVSSRVQPTEIVGFFIFQPAWHALCYGIVLHEASTVKASCFRAGEASLTSPPDLKP
jgi:hypothetical protein